MSRLCAGIGLFALLVMPARGRAQEMLLDQLFGAEAESIRAGDPQPRVWAGRWALVAPAWARPGYGPWPGLYDVRRPGSLVIGLVDTASWGAIEPSSVGRMVSPLGWRRVLDDSAGPECTTTGEARGSQGERRSRWVCADEEEEDAREVVLLEHSDGRWLIALLGDAPEVGAILGSLHPVAAPSDGSRAEIRGGLVAFRARGRPIADVASGYDQAGEMIAELHAPGDLRVAITFGEPNAGPVGRWERHPRKVAFLDARVRAFRLDRADVRGLELRVEGSGLGRAVPIALWGRTSEDLERAVALLEEAEPGPRAPEDCHVQPMPEAAPHKWLHKGPLADKPPANGPHEHRRRRHR